MALPTSDSFSDQRNPKDISSNPIQQAASDAAAAFSEESHNQAVKREVVNPRLSSHIDESGVVQFEPLEKPNAQGFASWLDKNFDALDYERDGKISAYEAANPNLKNRKLDDDASYLDLLQRAQHEISNLSNGSGEKDKAIEKADINALKVLATETEISRFGIANFDKLDADHNGRISQLELQTAQNLTPAERETAAKMNGHFRSLQNMSTDDSRSGEQGISLEDLKSCTKNVPSSFTEIEHLY